MPFESNMDIIDPDLNYFSELQNINCNRMTVNEAINCFNSDRNLFNVLNYNIRSFYSNSQNFLPLLDDTRVHALILTETWFTDTYQNSIVNFKSYHTIRSNQQSGGVSVYIDDSMKSRIIQDLSYCNIDIEICTVELHVNGELLYVIGIYRPHSGTISSFCEELERILCNPMLRNRRCILGGGYEH